MGQQPFAHLLVLRSARQGERCEGEHSTNLQTQAVYRCVETLEEPGVLL